MSKLEAIAYARRGQGGRKRPTSGWGAFTPTERDVVRLVSEGLANKDIATGFSSRRAPYRAISPTSTTSSASAGGCNWRKKLPDNTTSKDVFGQIRDSLPARTLIPSHREGHHLVIACRSISALG